MAQNNSFILNNYAENEQFSKII